MTISIDLHAKNAESFEVVERATHLSYAYGGADTYTVLQFQADGSSISMYLSLEQLDEISRQVKTARKNLCKLLREHSPEMPKLEIE